VTNYDSDSVMCIDPNTDSVIETIDLGSDARPYNYGDMTGSVAPAPPSIGTWTAFYDSETVNQEWGIVDWTADVPDDASLTVTASSSTDGEFFSPAEPVTDGVDLSVPNGQYLRVSVDFKRSTQGESPVLYDLAIRTGVSCEPRAVCEQGPNPAGQIPPASNQDGFWTVRGCCGDDCGEVPGLTMTVSDELTGTVFPGPFTPSGTNVKYVQAPGGKPGQKSGPGVVQYQLKGQGDMVVTVNVGGSTASQTCRVPPPPRN